MSEPVDFGERIRDTIAQQALRLAVVTMPDGRRLEFDVSGEEGTDGEIAERVMRRACEMVEVGE